MAVEVIQACSSLSAAASLLGLNWKSVHTIMYRAVERGLKLRQLDEVKHIGIDEKSFGKGQDYVSVMVDIDGPFGRCQAPVLFSDLGNQAICLSWTYAVWAVSI